MMISSILFLGLKEGGKTHAVDKTELSLIHFDPRYIVPDAKPVQCTICDGIHFRTKRNFAANLRIIMSVNKALTAILNEMRQKMKKIDYNLVKVKKNLEYLEDMYEGVFRKVNKLIVD